MKPSVCGFTLRRREHLNLTMHVDSLHVFRPDFSDLLLLHSTL